MKSLQSVLKEVMVTEAKMNDKSVMADFMSLDDVTKFLRKDASVKADLKTLKVKPKFMYWDDDALVVVDKTVAKGLADKNGLSQKISIGDLKKAIADHAKANAPKPKKPPLLDKGKNYHFERDAKDDKRIMIPAKNDKVVADIKAIAKTLGRGSIKLRPMKRKDGFKIWADAKNTKLLDDFIALL